LSVCPCSLANSRDINSVHHRPCTAIVRSAHTRLYLFRQSPVAVCDVESVELNYAEVNNHDTPGVGLDHCGMQLKCHQCGQLFHYTHELTSLRLALYTISTAIYGVRSIPCSRADTELARRMLGSAAIALMLSFRYPLFDIAFFSLFVRRKSTSSHQTYWSR